MYRTLLAKPERKTATRTWQARPTGGGCIGNTSVRLSKRKWKVAPSNVASALAHTRQMGDSVDSPFAAAAATAASTVRPKPSILMRIGKAEMRRARKLARLVRSAVYGWYTCSGWPLQCVQAVWPQSMHCSICLADDVCWPSHTQSLRASAARSMSERSECSELSEPSSSGSCTSSN